MSTYFYSSKITDNQHVEETIVKYRKWLESKRKYKKWLGEYNTIHRKKH